MEIDLGELEQFEKRLAEKRQQTVPPGQTGASCSTGSHEVDELDEYLDRLAIDIQSRETKIVDSASKNRMQSISLDSRNCDNNVDAVAIPVASPTLAPSVAKTSLPLLMFSFISILLYINSVVCKRNFIGFENGHKD